MTTFSPIAIVARSCVLPGALSPGNFWDALVAQQDLLSRVPEHYWRVSPDKFLCAPEAWTEGKIWSDRGGYVQGFEELFDPTGYARPVSDIRALDSQVHWLLYTARQVLREIGIYRGGRLLRERVGLLCGNLGYPTFALGEYAESVWAGQHERPLDPRNRFHSGFSAHYAAECLGLTGEAWCLDAACASSLYALKLACDRLHDGAADVMLAGAVNRCDDLAIHAGFCSLRALSPTGQSRPFHNRADGLVPAEGAAMFALMRLDEAQARDLTVLGVIRGIGLSNDGREGGFLSPSVAGQTRALAQAYAVSGLDPEDVSYVECHATGTPGGDRVELETLSQFFQDATTLRIGSHKSNVGHLITAAGAAGLLKILSSFEHRTLAPNRTADDLMALAKAPPLRVVTEAEPWHTSGPRRAGLNAFGFGGTNAHLIVEEWQDSAARHGPGTAAGSAGRIRVAIVGVAVRTGNADDADAFQRLLFGGKSRNDSTTIEEIAVDRRRLSFPPRDLDDTLPQQILMLETALEAAGACTLPAGETGVFVGAGCDAEASRWTCAARSSARCSSAVAEPQTAASVVGCMLNITANRINSQLSLLGPGFTCCAEELSGIRAFDTAVRMIRHGELQAAIVGAVDLSVETVHTTAARQALPANRQSPGDAAVALVLKRADHAGRDGDSIYAMVEDGGTPDRGGTPLLRLSLDDQNPGLGPLVGHAHAASGLLLVAAAALALRRRLLPVLDGQRAWPWLGFSDPRQAAVRVEALGRQRAAVRLSEFDPESPPVCDAYLTERPRVYAFSGETRKQLLRALDTGVSTSEGPWRLAWVATDDERDRARKEAADHLRTSEDAAYPESSRIFIGDHPIGGRVALVCSSAVGVYAGQGRELYRAFAQVVHATRPAREPAAAIVRAQTRWTDPYDDGIPGAFDRLGGARLLSRIHGLIARDVLRLPYDAAMGLSSGETDVMFAIDAADMNEALRQAEIALDTNLFTELVGGKHRCVRQAWGLAPDEELDWSMWRVIGSSDRIAEAVRDEPRAHLAIINAPADVVIVGERNACLRVLERGGAVSYLEIEGYELAYHVPELREGAVAVFREMHSCEWDAAIRPTIYSSAWAAPYVPSVDTYTEAIVAQATQTVDLGALVRRAYDDGIRIFVELGARNLSAGWIGQILDGKRHLAVSFDRFGVSSLRQAALASAQLFAAGVDLDIDAWNARMDELEGIPANTGPASEDRILMRGHREPMTLEEAAAAVMPPAPSLPGVICVDEAIDDEPDGTHEGKGPGQNPAQGGWETPLTRPPEAWPASSPSPASQVMDAIVQQREGFLNYTRTATEAHLKFLAFRAQLRRTLFRNPAPVCPEIHDANGDGGRILRQTQTRDATADSDLILPLAPRSAIGPSFQYEQLLGLASGRVSEVFGPLFEQQDAYPRQTRLPEPPLLLVDRILGLDADAGVHGAGTIWTESDVRSDSWYLHHGKMPAGIMVESGQADLALISYMGTDFKNRGERVYRLLGCQLTYLRGLARPGDTLRYQIEIESHVQHDDVRIFFFNYDCTIDGQLVMTVRRGHAGFFSDEELAQSDGVLWDPGTAGCDVEARLDPPAIACRARMFDAGRVRAFFEGRMLDCFGPGYERTLTHTRTPQPGSGLMRFFHEIPEFDPAGGPWGRGYLRARWNFAENDWFFRCHFKDDPCMPGTLMLEGAFQAMAFYLTALGYTLERDGWRFEPVEGITYDLRCRGQATPESTYLDCELFVEELHSEPEPTLFVDVLGTVDGLKALYCRRLALKLVPDFPLSDRAESIPPVDASRTEATLDGIPLEYGSLLHCAIGEPMKAFGHMTRGLPLSRRCPRLPGPPYHFMTRVSALNTRPSHPDVGGSIEAEYDIPPNAWYFRDGANGAMPFSALLETGLQPCGWLAACSGIPFKATEELYFRNLDGKGAVYREVFPDSARLSVRVELRDCSSFAGATILQFKIDSRCGLEPVAEWETSFGFFSRKALAQQAGLSADSRPSLESEYGVEHCSWREFLARTSADNLLRVQDGRLALLERVTGYWPDGGGAGLGRLRADRRIAASDWYFKAHFYQDPVQPGSLGIEAVLQLMRALMIRKEFAAGCARPRFRSVACGETFQWTYRGQVLPENEMITVDTELVDVHRDEAGVTAWADASLSVDGLRIYQVRRLPVRIDCR